MGAHGVCTVCTMRHNKHCMAHRRPPTTRLLTHLAVLRFSGLGGPPQCVGALQLQRRQPGRQHGRQHGILRLLCYSYLKPEARNPHSEARGAVDLYNTVDLCNTVEPCLSAFVGVTEHVQPHHALPATRLLLTLSHGNTTQGHNTTAMQGPTQRPGALQVAHSATPSHQQRPQT